MDNLKLCVICLNTNVKLFKSKELTYYYNDIVLKPTPKEYCNYYCHECTALLQKYYKFKQKCFTAIQILHEWLWDDDTQKSNTIDRSELKSSLDYSKVENCSTCFSHQHHKYIDCDKKCDEHTITSKQDLVIETTCEDGKPDIKQEIENDNDNIDDVFGDNEVMFNQDDEVKDTVFVQIKKEMGDIITNSKRITRSNRANREHNKKTKKNKRISKTKNNSKPKRDVLSEHWKRYKLKEEDAIKEFNNKCLNEKYLNATYKCIDCFRPFSKEEMYVRHRDLKHPEVDAMLECDFCKYRFRLHCHLRRHLQQHYERFKCLRCEFICCLETSAVFHDQFHNGVIWKCKYCNEEFRHCSTYYSHVRVVHRSEFVCSRCGLSFVSRLGLHQHTKIKHYQELSSNPPADLIESKTHCERCDVKFESEGAYLEHVLHSLLHEDDSLKNANQDDMVNRPTGMRLKAGITEVVRRRMKTRKSNSKIKKDCKPGKSKKCREMFKKPTTCYQCGEHFSSQSQFTRHHISVHPRTSAVPPESRTICELCGISLAPGSVAAHQNLHNKSNIYSCTTCGRQFYTNMSLKRHTVTHTGEKPYACSLCDKRFTQSNSMKLHYRTFHLKEPYPKRNRKKKIVDIPPEVTDIAAEISNTRPQYINM